MATPKSAGARPQPVASVSHSELACLYAPTLTAAAFLAPKGVPCTLCRLAPIVLGLCDLELNETQLRRMCGLDASLALRFAVGADGEVELELIMRESLRTVATPGAVRSRHKRFLKLLAEAASEIPMVPLPPLPAGIVQSGGASCTAFGGLGVSSSIAASAREVHSGQSGSDNASSFGSPSRASASGTAPHDTSGLPSPPPRPLRRAALAAPTPPDDAQRHRERDVSGGGESACGGAARQAGGAALAADACDDEWDEEVRPAPMAPANGTTEARAEAARVAARPSGGVAKASACDRFLRHLRHSPFLTDQIVHYHEQPARPPSFSTPEVDLAPAVRAVLEATGRTRLFSHQARAVEALMGGEHVMLCTPTASGKSLGYLIPTLHAMATDGASRALLLFPTKALAQDQKRALRALTNAGATALFGLPVATYDGDTPQAERADLRQSTRVFLSNPDMLHCSILPQHKEWAAFLSNLKYVVLDEAHMYQGVFGAHVALILRRLRRLTALYGSQPSFVCCSATVGNPAEVFERLTGIDRDRTAVITADGSPHGRRRLLFWNPPLAAQPTPLPEGKGVPLKPPAQQLWKQLGSGGGAAVASEGGASGEVSEGGASGEVNDGGAGETTSGRCAGSSNISRGSAVAASGSVKPPRKRRRAAAAAAAAPAETGATATGAAASGITASAEAASGFSASEEARRLAALARRNHESGDRRRSSNIEAAVLLAEMVRANLKTICFCSVRKICELVLDYARQHLRAESPAEGHLLGAYRGGLTSADRRRIEGQLYDGTIRGVTATSSLELGVDIASLDGVIMNGFPGSLASLWQRAGRCGRTADSDSLAVLIAYPSAIDQWVMRHPERTLAMNVEPAVIDVANPIVLEQHLLCAAKEQPLCAEDTLTVGGATGTGEGVAAEARYREALRRLHASGKLVPILPPAPQVADRAPRDTQAATAAAAAVTGGDLAAMPAVSWRCDELVQRPAALCNIRSIDQTRVQVVMRTVRRRDQPTLAEVFGGGGFGAAEAPPAMVEEDEVIDEVERLRCWYELYEGAIYLNQGRKFEVVSWEAPSGLIRVRPTNARYYTGCLDKLKVHVVQRNEVTLLHVPDAHDGASKPSEGGGGKTGEGTVGVPAAAAATATASAAAAVAVSATPAATATAAESNRPSCGQLCRGRVRVSLEVAGFVKRWQKTGEIFEEVPLRMPEYGYDTRACWIDLAETSMSELASLGLAMDAGLHALAHALLAMLPLRLSCDPSDVGCECDALRHRQLWPKRLLLFDKREGGLGIADRAAAVLLPLLRDALELMSECECANGCYCCVHSSKCGEYNAGVDKRAAIALANHVLQEAAKPLAAAPTCVPCEEEEDEEARGAANSEADSDGEAGGSQSAAPPEGESMLGRSIAIMRSLAPGPQRVAGGIRARPPIR